MTIWIWAAAGILYLAFAAWYFNWSEPLTSTEVDAYMSAFHETKGTANTDAKIFRKFLDEDDGREFVMQNLVRFHTDKIPHPISGEPTNPRKVLNGYFGPFSSALFKRAGHPVIASQKVGGYIDSWSTAADPNWDLVSLIRYRSRRDLAELIVDPFFEDIHVFKNAAIEQTASFPTQTAVSFFLSPKFFVPLLLLLSASLVQNVMGLFR